MHTMTAIFAYSCCWWAWVGLERGCEQCRPEAWAVRGSASMPEAPSWRGGIATNEVTMAKELVKLEAEIKALRNGLILARSWLHDNYSKSGNESYFMDLKTIDQLLTKNEG